jgi:hypothetical protein
VGDMSLYFSMQAVSLLNKRTEMDLPIPEGPSMKSVFLISLFNI